MTRTTGKAEIVKAAVECIAYQITDIVNVMSEEAGVAIEELRVDGGPTKNGYLMQFQSDLLSIPVQVPNQEELSGIGVAYLAGIVTDFYDKRTIFNSLRRNKYEPAMDAQKRDKLYQGWKEAVKSVIHE
jgi:glycerol kinase